MSNSPHEFDLTRLIHPVDPELFKKTYWEKRPLIVLRDQPDYYSSLLSVSDVDHILSTSSIRPSEVRLVKMGKDIPINGAKSTRLFTNAMMLDALYEQYRAGATVVIQFLHERWGSLANLTTSLARELSAICQVNVYLTPPEEQGLGMHYDTHDVLVLQTQGSKRWRVSPGGPVRLPLDNRPYVRNSEAHRGDIEEFNLTAGSMIYIPRGFLHEAVCEKETSLHLTLGIKTVTWAHVLQGALDAVFDGDPRFRESLPPGFASDERVRKRAAARLSDLLDAARRQMEPTRLIADAVTTATRGTQTAAVGHLLDLIAGLDLTLDTKVSRRPEIDHRVEADKRHTFLKFHGKSIRMPAYVENDLRFISESDAFKTSDLPGDLDDPSKILLVQRLIREGFLSLEHDRAGWTNFAAPG